MDDENVSTSTGRSGRGTVTFSDMKKRKNGSKNEFGQEVNTFREKTDGHASQASETAGGGKTSEAEVKHYDADGTFTIIPPTSRRGNGSTTPNSIDQGLRVRWYRSLGWTRYPRHVRGPRLGCVGEPLGHLVALSVILYFFSYIAVFSCLYILVVRLYRSFNQKPLNLSSRSSRI